MSAGFCGHHWEKVLSQPLTRVKSISWQMMRWAKFTLNTTLWKLVEFRQGPVMPVKPPCCRSFLERLCWCTLLSQSYLRLVTNLLREADKLNSVYVCASVPPLRTNRPPISNCGLRGFADLPLSQEVNDFKPCSRIQNIHNTDMKYQHKLILIAVLVCDHIIYFST